MVLLVMPLIVALCSSPTYNATVDVFQLFYFNTQVFHSGTCIIQF